jgi:glyoxalase family protein
VSDRLASSTAWSIISIELVDGWLDRYREGFPMSPTINGLHHVTAISGAPQRNLDFYAKVLGLRFVKRTVNFDDPSVYHLYYGNETGAPGTAMTFFPWEHLQPAVRGTGEVAQTGFSVPAGSLDFWRDRLSRLGVAHQEAEPRFGEPALTLADPDGLPLALVAAAEPDARVPWITAEIGAEHAVRGFHGVTLTLDVGAATAELLTEVMGYEHVASEGGVHRYAAPHGAPARYVDIVEAPDGAPAWSGLGSVHHIAFAVADDDAQDHFRWRLIRAGHRVTPRIDRTYFHSIYFRTPGGVLFEIATAGPGFTVDEPRATLGQELKLPPQHEHLRARLEDVLPPLLVE